MTCIEFEVSRSKVKVTVTFKFGGIHVSQIFLDFFYFITFNWDFFHVDWDYKILFSLGSMNIVK